MLCMRMQAVICVLYVCVLYVCMHACLLVVRLRRLELSQIMQAVGDIEHDGTLGRRVGGDQDRGV